MAENNIISEARSERQDKEFRDAVVTFMHRIWQECSYLSNETDDAEHKLAWMLTDEEFMRVYGFPKNHK